MYPRVVAIVLLGFALITAPAFAQTYPQRGPDQPVRPQLPRLERRAPQPPPPPFTLTPQQEAQVDRVLNLWEQRNRKIKTFDCRFTRWIYDATFPPPQSLPNQPLQPKLVELGVIKYAAPDRGLFRVEATEKDGRKAPIENNQAEHWICDGKSVFQYEPVKKQLIEYKLPPERQGKAITDTPLPFLFCAEAKTLKQRYFIRIRTPRDVRDHIWLEAYPRFQQDAANFKRARFVVAAEGMSPFALEILQRNGKDFTRYQFYDIVVNDPLKFFQGNPFRPFTPLGWQRVVEEPQPVQAHRRPTNGRR